MVRPPDSSFILARQDKLRRSLRRRGLEAVLTGHLPSVRYLTGFDGSYGFALTLREEGFVLTDPRYEFAVAGQAIGYEPRVVKPAEMHKAISDLLKRAGARSLYCESDFLLFEDHRELKKNLKGVELAPGPSLTAELRAVKDDGEIERIRKAARWADRTFKRLLSIIRPGVSELDLAVELKCHLLKQKAEGMSFEPIVASGPRSALAHAKPSARKIKNGDFLLLDFGAVADGYCSDMTRTVCVGKPDDEKKRIYRTVLEAQQRALDGVKKGVMTARIDRSAREVVEKAGYGPRFTHGLGHGIGLEVHEAPRVSPFGSSRLKPGCVITIEPGVYIQGLGGVRIEDTVAVTQNGREILTKSPKKLIVL